jgi:hypothetical protein
MLLQQIIDRYRIAHRHQAKRILPKLNSHNLHVERETSHMHLRFLQKINRLHRPKIIPNVLPIKLRSRMPLASRLFRHHIRN